MTKEKQKKQTAEKPAKAARITQADENIILIGKKPVMNYVVACLTFFNSGAKKLLLRLEGGQSVEQSTPLSC